MDECVDTGSADDLRGYPIAATFIFFLCSYTAI